MAIAGMRGTGDWGTDERPKDFRELILWRNPNGGAPLTALMAKMRKEKTTDPEFSWWEEQMDALRLTMANGTAYDSSATSIVVSSNVSDALDVVAGDVFLVGGTLTSAYANELVIASSVTNTTTVVFKRGQLGTSAATIPAGVDLTKVGNIFEEGSIAPEAATRNPTKLYNYAQIFKTVYELTETARVTKTRTGDPVSNDKKRKLFDHSVAMEMAAFFGKRFEGTGANGKPIRSSGGLLYFLSQYAPSMITVFSTTPTETTFTDAIYKVFDYSTGAGDERLVFAGNGALNSLNRLANSQSRVRVNYDGIVEFFGMKLQRWVLPQGVLYVKSHPLFNTHSRFTNEMAVLDPTALRLRQLRATKAKDNIQNNDEDSLKGMWISEEGFEFNHLKTCAWISNFIV